MTREVQMFYAKVPVATRQEIASVLNQHSADSFGEQAHVEDPLPVLDRPLEPGDARLTDELCQRFASTKMTTERIMDEDLRVRIWSLYLDTLVLRINSMDVIEGGTTDPELLLG